MQKYGALFLMPLMGVILLTGCFGGLPASSATPESTPMAASAAAATQSMLNVSFFNSTDYVFNEIYISPTAANDWGDELLGSTRVLKSNGSVDVEIPAYEYDNYDIRVMDEDRDVYEFTFVAIQNSAQVAISFGEEGLTASVTDQSGAETAAVLGTLNGGTAEETYDEYDEYEEYEQQSNAGYDTDGAYSFTVYNESDYDIYAINMGLATANSEDDMDVLPEVLESGDSIEISGTLPEDQWGETEWTLHVTDDVGDVSASFDVFDPWLVSYVDITWDVDSNGYVCEFFY